MYCDTEPQTPFVALHLLNKMDQRILLLLSSVTVVIINVAVLGWQIDSITLEVFSTLK